jgi:hypothetical protein
MEGTCPADYKTRILALFFETIWDTSVFRNISGHFLLSNGNQTGKNSHFLIEPHLIWFQVLATMETFRMDGT